MADSDRWERLERAYNIVKARRRRNEKLKKRREQKRAQRRQLLAKAVTSLLVLGALWWAIGGIFNPAVATLLVGVLAVGSWFSSQVSGIGIPFALSLLIAVVLLTEFVFPPAVVEAFSPFMQMLASLTGIKPATIAGVDAIAFAILGVFFILVYWALSIRLGTSRNMKATTVAKRMETKAENLAETYLTFGRVLAIFAVAVGAIAVQQFSSLSAEVVGYLANAPLATSNFLTGLTGYLALGGFSPVWVPDFVRTMGPGGFLAVVVLLLIGAYGLREVIE